MTHRRGRAPRRPGPIQPAGMVPIITLASRKSHTPVGVDLGRPGPMPHGPSAWPFFNFQFSIKRGRGLQSGGPSHGPAPCLSIEKAAAHLCKMSTICPHVHKKIYSLLSLYIYMYASARGRAHARARMRGKISVDMWTYCGHFQTTPYHPCLRLATQP